MTHAKIESADRNAPHMRIDFRFTAVGDYSDGIERDHIIVEPPYTLGDWLEDHAPYGVAYDYDPDAAEYVEIKDGEKTGWCYQILSQAPTHENLIF